MKSTLRQSRSAPSEQLLLAFDSPRSAFTPSDGSPAKVRRVAVDGGVVEYRLQRVRRRTIGFQVDEHGLTVRAPRWITLREIEAVIAKNEGWIRRKRIEWGRWRERLRPAAAHFTDGGSVQYLGKMTRLRLRIDTAAPHSVDDTDEIRLALCPHAPETEVRGALQVWLQNQARRIFGERIERFADRIDARFAGWRLSSARTQWGSCSHDGRIRLNWRLVHFSLPVVDYVIAHELAHLRELNHSRKFWDEVAHLLPGFEAARDQIKGAEIDAIWF